MLVPVTRQPLKSAKQILKAACAGLGSVLLSGCVSMPEPMEPVGAAAPAATAPVPTRLNAPAPSTMQWLYGSGEAAGASIQAWRSLADFAIEKARAKQPAMSTYIGIDGKITAPQTCGSGDAQKPFAVIFDVDETVLLNLGYEYWSAISGISYTRPTWKEWEETGSEKIRPVPGAAMGISSLREAGITPVFNTNRQYSPEGAATAIAFAGLGDAEHRKTLFLRGDDGVDSSAKDGRRKLIADKYCVLALVGDNLGDFADIFNDEDLSPMERRELASRPDLARVWGKGWFILPNPVYGDSLKGSIAEVFPEDTRWTPQASVSPAPANSIEGN